MPPENPVNSSASSYASWTRKVSGDRFPENIPENTAPENGNQSALERNTKATRKKRTH